MPEAVQALDMRSEIVVNITPGDCRRLEAIVSDGYAPQKHVWRAKIVLATGDGCGRTEIMRWSGKAKPVVWHWQVRFMAEGVAAGLTRDRTRKPNKPPPSAATVRRVVDSALSPPPGEATSWTDRMQAEAAGVSLRSVQRLPGSTPSRPYLPNSRVGAFRRGVYRSVQVLKSAINRFVAETNTDPIVWTADPRHCQTRKANVRVSPLGTFPLAEASTAVRSGPRCLTPKTGLVENCSN
jgi:hypothetical protein